MLWCSPSPEPLSNATLDSFSWHRYGKISGSSTHWSRQERLRWPNNKGTLNGAPFQRTELPPNNTDSHEEDADSSQYDAIVREYGEAMLQMRQLHSRVDGLARQLKDSVGESDDSDDSDSSSERDRGPDLSKVLSRIEDVERWLLDGAATGHDARDGIRGHTPDNTAATHDRVGNMEARLHEEASRERGRTLETHSAAERATTEFLERVEALERRLGVTRDGTDGHTAPTSMRGASEYTAFQTRIDALERWNLLERIAGLEGRVLADPTTESLRDITTKSPNSATSLHTSDRSDEIAELRFQIANLTMQLSKAEAQLKQVHDSRRRSRKSSDSHLTWQFWRGKKSR